MGDKQKIKKFYDLNVWRDAHQVALDIYKITEQFPKEEQFGLTSQIRRAISSVTANIAEGFGRYHYKDKIKFYLQARGSLLEAQNFIFLAQDLGYLKKDAARKIFQACNDIQIKLNALIKANKKPNS